MIPTNNLFNGSDLMPRTTKQGAPFFRAGRVTKRESGEIGRTSKRHISARG